MRPVLAVVTGLLLGLVVFSCGREALPQEPLEDVQRTSPPITNSPPTTQNPPLLTSTTGTTVPPKGWVVIHGTGDVNLDPNYIPALAGNGYEWAWSGLDGLFLEDDLTVVNLECSPSPLGVAEPKDFVFQCPEGLEEMAAAGVEVANLGNNHSQDYGKDAMLDGRQNLLNAGISPVGAGSNAIEAASPALFEIEGWKIAVVGFGGIRPHDGWVATDDQAGMADGDTIESMVTTVEEASSMADFVVVSVHWGVELDSTPSADDVERAQAMIAAGADAIFGHHPHRLQPFEIVDDRPVAWSLGNFVWPDISPVGSTTGVARVVISPDGEVTGCLIPALIEGSGHPVLAGDPPCGAP